MTRKVCPFLLATPTAAQISLTLSYLHCSKGIALTLRLKGSGTSATVHIRMRHHDLKVLVDKCAPQDALLRSLQRQQCSIPCFVATATALDQQLLASVALVDDDGTSLLLEP